MNAHELTHYLEIKGEKKKEVADINDPIETRLFETRRHKHLPQNCAIY